MRPSAEVKAAVIAAHGSKSAGALAREHGLTRNQVIGIQHRRDRSSPEEAARAAAEQSPTQAEANVPAAEPARWTPETASFSGQSGAVWAALLAAGPAGVTAEAMLARMYPHGLRPASTKTAYTVVLLRLRDAVKPHGCAIAVVEGVTPTRWRIVRPDAAVEVASSAAVADAARAPAVPPPVAAAAPIPPVLVAPAPERAEQAAPRRISPAPPRAEAAPFIGLAGAALAVHELRPRACRWPIGEPGADDFRFCCAPAAEEGKPYCAEHRRAASAGRWAPGRAA